MRVQGVVLVVVLNMTMLNPLTARGNYQIYSHLPG
jgi:hypothetical protein